MTEYLAPITLQTAGERIAERIVTAIALGEFVPDQRLPTERDLAAMLEVSRTTVREALQRLQASGYVTTRRGRAGGTFVATGGWRSGPAAGLGSSGPAAGLAPGAACRHNLLYWSGGNWWGVGPGAHSHIGGTRWWNVRHPAAYASRIAAGISAGQAREVLTEAERRTERIMLETRLVSGCPVSVLHQAGRRAAESAVADGLADPSSLEAGQVVLTLAGRLLADAVIRGLTE